MPTSSLCVAVHDFVPSASPNSAHLPLSRGQIIRVINKHASGWWDGQVVNSQQRGWFPSNYVKEQASARSPTKGEAVIIQKSPVSRSEPIDQALLLLKTVLQQNEPQHLKTIISCIISIAKHTLVQTNCLHKTDPALQHIPGLASVRKEVLKSLQKLVREFSNEQINSRRLQHYAHDVKYSLEEFIEKFEGRDEAPPLTPSTRSVTPAALSDISASNSVNSPVSQADVICLLRQIIEGGSTLTQAAIMQKTAQVLDGVKDMMIRVSDDEEGGPQYREALVEGTRYFLEEMRALPRSNAIAAPPPKSPGIPLPDMPTGSPLPAGVSAPLRSPRSPTFSGSPLTPHFVLPHTTNLLRLCDAHSSAPRASRIPVSAERRDSLNAAALYTVEPDARMSNTSHDSVASDISMLSESSEIPSIKYREEDDAEDDDDIEAFLTPGILATYKGTAASMPAPRATRPGENGSLTEWHSSAADYRSGSEPTQSTSTLNDLITPTAANFPGASAVNPTPKKKKTGPGFISSILGFRQGTSSAGSTPVKAEAEKPFKEKDSGHSPFPERFEEDNGSTDSSFDDPHQTIGLGIRSSTSSPVSADRSHRASRHLSTTSSATGNTIVFTSSAPIRTDHGLPRSPSPLWSDSQE